MDKDTSISDVMTKQVTTVSPDTSVFEAAQLMSEEDIGGLIVNNADGTICGILTDRDITIRSVAKRQDPGTTRVDQICSKASVYLAPTDTINDAVKTMADAAVRRIPVIDDGVVVGIVSLGDLSLARQPNSALGSISAAAPNQ